MHPLPRPQSGSPSGPVRWAKLRNAFCAYGIAPIFSTCSQGIARMYLPASLMADVIWYHLYPETLRKINKKTGNTRRSFRGALSCCTSGAGQGDAGCRRASVTAVKDSDEVLFPFQPGPGNQNPGNPEGSNRQDRIDRRLGLGYRWRVERDAGRSRLAFIEAHALEW